MTIGQDEDRLKHDMSWDMTTGFNTVDRELANSIATAVAKAIARNNEEIAARLRAAGVKV